MIVAAIRMPISQISRRMIVWTAFLSDWRVFDRLRILAVIRETIATTP